MRPVTAGNIYRKVTQKNNIINTGITSYSHKVKANSLLTSFFDILQRTKYEQTC